MNENRFFNNPETPNEYVGESEMTPAEDQATQERLQDLNSIVERAKLNGESVENIRLMVGAYRGEHEGLLVLEMNNKIFELNLPNGEEATMNGVPLSREVAKKIINSHNIERIFNSTYGYQKETIENLVEHQKAQTELVHAERESQSAIDKEALEAFGI